MSVMHKRSRVSAYACLRSHVHMRFACGRGLCTCIVIRAHSQSVSVRFIVARFSLPVSLSLSLFLSYFSLSVLPRPLSFRRVVSHPPYKHRYTHAFLPPPSLSFSFSRGRSSIREDAHIGSASMHSSRSRRSNVRE